MNEIVMPKLSDTMTEGRLVSWKKRVGDQVQRGDVLAEVETDKANMELEAFTAGVLLEVRVQAGDLVEVGTVIAIIGSEQEKGAQGAQAPKEEPVQAPPVAAGAVGGAPTGGAEPGQGAAAEEPPGVAAAAQQQTTTVQPPIEGQAPSEVQVPAEVQLAEPGESPDEVQARAQAKAQVRQQAQQQPQQPSQTQPQPQSQSQSQSQPQAQAQAQPQAEPVERAAPVVRRRARELGIDLGQLKGTGPEGRILLQDLEQDRSGAAPGAGGEEPARHPAAAATPATEGAAGVTPLSRLRSAVAKTVAESWRTIPHFSVTAEILMGEAEAVRRQLKNGGVPVTLNDLIVKAVALALIRHPRLNASFAGEGVEMHNQINIGVAVGVPDGVLIPVIPGCQSLSLQQIAELARGLVDRARAGALAEHDLAGGTFSVSNLGMYGVSEFNAIIYPRQAGVLAVGAVSDAVVGRSGCPVCVRSMKVTLSADHRVVDGAYAAEFLAELKEILENPVRLLI